MHAYAVGSQRLIRPEIFWRAIEQLRQFIKMIEIVFFSPERTLNIPDKALGNIKPVGKVFLTFALLHADIPHAGNHMPFNFCLEIPGSH